MNSGLEEKLIRLDKLASKSVQMIFSEIISRDCCMPRSEKDGKKQTSLVGEMKEGESEYYSWLLGETDEDQ